MVCFEVVETSLCGVGSVDAAGCSVVEAMDVDLLDVVGIEVGWLEVGLVEVRLVELCMVVETFMEVSLTEVVFTRNIALPEADVPVIVFWPKMITHSKIV